MPKKSQPRRRLIIPPAEDRICSADGWELFDRSHIEFPPYETQPVGKASPLWPSLKAVHMIRKGKRGAGRRAYWLRYGVLVSRFRHCHDAKEFITRFPTVYTAFEERCRRFHTVAKWKQRLGETGFAQAEARLAQSTVTGNEKRAAIYERAHAAALEEDALWRLLFE